MSVSDFYAFNALASTIDPDKTDLGAGTVASVVITGLSVVFIGLIILIICVTIYGKIFEAINKKADEKAKAAAEAAAAEKVGAVKAEEPAPAKALQVEDGIEEETVAVIMAAISAMYASGGKKAVVRSVRASRSATNVWASAGAVQNTRPF